MVAATCMARPGAAGRTTRSPGKIEGKVGLTFSQCGELKAVSPPVTVYSPDTSFSGAHATGMWLFNFIALGNFFPQYFH